MEQVIEEFKTVKSMPNWGKNRALPEPNRHVLKVMPQLNSLFFLRVDCYDNIMLDGLWYIEGAPIAGES